MGLRIVITTIEGIPLSIIVVLLLILPTLWFYRFKQRKYEARIAVDLQLLSQKMHLIAAFYDTSGQPQPLDVLLDVAQDPPLHATPEV